MTFYTACLTIVNNDPRIYFHGCWDSSPGSWWPGMGFKLLAQNLTMLSLNLETFTSSLASIGVSINYQNFSSVDVYPGSNEIPLGHPSPNGSVIHINAWGWQNNQILFQNLVLNSGVHIASMSLYKPTNVNFLFIGNSLSVGQYLLMGVDQAWPFIVGEWFKAEHTVIAQPGITLADVQSWYNTHGMSVQFFDTEDSNYATTPNHNYMTPWNFSHDKLTPTHIVIHIGANDVSHVSASQFVQIYLAFIQHLRQYYPDQPIFVNLQRGWPQPNGSVSYYYIRSYQQIVSMSQDPNVHLIDMSGWVGYADIFPDNSHPNVAGHQKIAGEFANWLANNFSLSPASQWATPI
ncbi:SGNH hydrolase-type esterase domain-containing protein [Armillaria novae-zelandiae]|uniref:SGNH hydrolase-type esterase domain-containing protein n=1 Tax=Armillaria novae-zelandiae TaxID=153914 RepID=A0AA39PCV7_9AGAR|nr:SGNH hydrolase-type esterase domain-containing protein [Armillaria novae-zelandiae]